MDATVKLAANRFLARNRKPWGWFAVPSAEALVYVPLKCGSTSFRFAFCPGLESAPPPRARRFYEWATAEHVGPFERLELAVVPYGDFRRLLAVRNPLERFASLWRETWHRDSPAFAPLKGLTPEQLFEVIEAHPDADPHWRRQSDWMLDRVEPVRFDRLLERLGLPHQHRRRTGRDPKLDNALLGDRQLHERLAHHYLEDCRLWLQAKAAWSS